MGVTLLLAGVFVFYSSSFGDEELRLNDRGARVVPFFVVSACWLLETCESRG